MKITDPVDMNYEPTGGEFGFRRRLATYTIGYNAATERYFATDDQADGRTRATGFGTLQAIVNELQPDDDRRMGRKDFSRF